MGIESQERNKTRVKPQAAIRPRSMGLATAAATLDVSESFLRLEMARGHLETFRLGRRVLVTPESLEAYLAARSGK